jgi:hypothetical protein
MAVGLMIGAYRDDPVSGSVCRRAKLRPQRRLSVTITILP